MTRQPSTSRLPGAASPAGGDTSYLAREWRIEYGAVLAVAEIVGCHQHTDPMHPCDHADAPLCSLWAMRGQWHWELADVRPLRRPVPCKGRQRLWRLPSEVDEAVRAQLDTRSINTPTETPS